MPSKNYYKVLGIARSESKKGIREAFRRLVKIHHPDKGGSDRTGRYRDIVEAYEVLSDPQKRKAYDRNLEQMESPDQKTAGGGTPKKKNYAEPLIRNKIDSGIDWEFVGNYVDVFFNYVFSKTGIEKNLTLESSKDHDLEIILSPSEARRGGKIRLVIPFESQCRYCGGSDAIRRFQCMHCLGSGTEETETEIVLEIPPDVPDGTSVRISVPGPGGRKRRLKALISIQHDGRFI